jgi:hypothetical protein
MTIVGLIISTCVLIVVYRRRKHFYDVKSLLCINNYLLVFFVGIIVLLQNFDIIRADFGLLIIKSETFGCRLRGYIFFSLLSAVYQAFILQVITNIIVIV